MTLRSAKTDRSSNHFTDMDVTFGDELRQTQACGICAAHPSGTPRFFGVR